jgi:hypothetical protein
MGETANQPFQLSFNPALKGLSGGGGGGSIECVHGPLTLRYDQSDFLTAGIADNRPDQLG